MTALNGTSVNCCWEEVQHALLGQDPNHLTDVVDPRWFTYLMFMADARSNREHVCIDVAVKTANWLRALEPFEQEIRRAHRQAMTLLKAGVPVNREVENDLWKDAFRLWNASWAAGVVTPRGQELIPNPLDAAIRARYETLAGVRFPSPDEVRRFYENGNVTDDPDPLVNRGEPVRVPAWVMQPLPPGRMKLAVIETTPDPPQVTVIPPDPAKGDLGRFMCAFDARALDTYLPGRYAMALHRNPLLRGAITFFIRQPIDLEAQAGIEVEFNGRVYKGRPQSDGYLNGQRGVQFDLRKAYQEIVGKPLPPWSNLPPSLQPITFKVKFYRQNCAEISDERQYQIGALFRDRHDSTGAAVYENALKVFLVKVKPAKVQQTSSTTTAPPASGGERADVEDNHGFCIARLKNEFTGLKLGTPQANGIYRNAVATAGKITMKSEATLFNGYGVVLSASSSFTRANTGWQGGPSLELKSDDKTLNIGNYFKFWPNPAWTKSFELPIEIPKGTKSGEIKIVWRYWGPNLNGHETVLQVMFTVPPGLSGATALPPSEPPTVEISTVEEEAPQEEDKPLPPPPPPPEKKKSAGGVTTGSARWYTHLTGDYRFPLAKGWRVAARTLLDAPNQEFDTLLPEDEQMALVCARDRKDLGETTASTSLDKAARLLLKTSPNGRVERNLILPGKDVCVTHHDAKSGIMAWRLVLYHKGRSYFLTVLMPSSSPKASIPAAVAGMLRAIQFLR